MTPRHTCAAALCELELAEIETRAPEAWAVNAPAGGTAP
jgi:hypothetical protein